MARRLWVLLIMLSLAAFMAPPVQADGPAIHVYINGVEQHFDPPPVLLGSSTFVPMRAIFEALGATVSWEPERQTVRATGGNRKVVLQIGSLSARVNDQEFLLAAPPVLLDGRTFVPLRFVSTALGCQVDWDATTRSVHITGPGQLVMLEFWHVLHPDTANGRALTQLVERFNASQTELWVKAIYQGSYSDLEQKLTVAEVAGEPPAVVMVTSSLLVRAARARILRPLEDLVPAADRTDYFPNLLTGQTYRGALYGLPFNQSVQVLVYDRSLVPVPPQTWDELRDVAERVKGPGRAGTVFRPDIYYFGLFLRQAGGEWMANGAAAFDGEAGIKALTFMKEMVDSGAARVLRPKSYESDAFNEGSVAMVVTTSTTLAYIKPAGGRPWGVAPLFAGPGGEATPLSGAGVAITSGQTPEQAAAAARFITWLTGKESTLALAMAGAGYAPVRKSAVADPAWQARVSANEFSAVLSESIARGAADPTEADWLPAVLPMNTILEKVMAGTISIADGLGEGAAAFNRRIAPAK